MDDGGIATARVRFSQLKDSSGGYRWDILCKRCCKKRGNSRYRIVHALERIYAAKRSDKQKKLGSIVFADKEKLALLNNITHLK